MLLDVDLVSVSTTAIDLNENVRQNILFYFLTFNEMQVRQNLESQAINQRWKLKKREIIRKKIIKKPMTRVTTHSTASISRWSFSFFFFIARAINCTSIVVRVCRLLFEIYAAITDLSARCPCKRVALGDSFDPHVLLSKLFYLTFLHSPPRHSSVLRE